MWDPELGFDRIGPPQALGVPGNSHRPENAPQGQAYLFGSYNRTQFVRRNRWSAAGSSGSADQGLFFFLFHARLRGYKVAVHLDYQTHHFQSPGKPWESSPHTAALMLQWPYYRDMPPPGNRTRCTRLLTAQLRALHRKRTRATAEANRSGITVWAKRDPVTGMRYRKFRRQPVF